MFVVVISNHTFFSIASTATLFCLSSLAALVCSKKEFFGSFLENMMNWKLFNKKKSILILIITI
jgi:hypothetical protein